MYVLRDRRELIELDELEATEMARIRLADRPMYSSLVVLDDAVASPDRPGKARTGRTFLLPLALGALVSVLVLFGRYAAQRVRAEVPAA